MKIIVTLILLISSLAATAVFYFGGFSHNEGAAVEKRHAEPVNVKRLFDQSASYMKSIIKRGDIENIAHFQNNMALLMKGLQEAKQNGAKVAELENNIAKYAQVVMAISDEMQNSASTLHSRYEMTQEKLEEFNLRISRIGLYELKEAWMDLSRLKNDFIREPNMETKAAFELQWMHTKILIGELYLDEPMEDPLFAYLDNYKAYVDGIASVYNAVGMQRVAKIKPLSYTIKSQISLLPLHQQG